MFIGYAQNIITPSLERPVFLAGFGQNRRATAIHDDLYVRALALRSSGTDPGAVRPGPDRILPAGCAGDHAAGAHAILPGRTGPRS